VAAPRHDGADARVGQNRPLDGEPFFSEIGAAASTGLPGVVPAGGWTCADAE